MDYIKWSTEDEKSLQQHTVKAPNLQLPFPKTRPCTVSTPKPKPAGGVGEDTFTTCAGTQQWNSRAGAWLKHHKNK